METRNCIYKEKCLRMILKIFYCLKAIILSFIQTIFHIVIGIIALFVVTYFFTIFLHVVTALASYFLVDLSSMPQKDIITQTVKEYFKFTKDDVPGFSKAVSQTAIGALIGTSFTLFVNFLIKSVSERRNRLTSLRTALTVVELNIQSLLLLKSQFIIPKFKATENCDFEKELPSIINMTQTEFLQFLESKEIIFKKILNPDYAIDLDPKQFFYFLGTESNSDRERLDTMLYHYCRAKENIGYLNAAIKHQVKILDESQAFEDNNFPIPREKRAEYTGRFLFKIKKSNDDISKLLEVILVFLFELEREIKDFPGIKKSKNFLKKEFLILIPREETYKLVLDEWYYNRHETRKM